MARTSGRSGSTVGFAATAENAAFGSGNVFEDLGLPDADGLLRKADLASAISMHLKRGHVTEEEAAVATGLASELLRSIRRGDLDDLRLDELEGVLRLVRDADRRRISAEQDASRIGIG